MSARTPESDMSLVYSFRIQRALAEVPVISDRRKEFNRFWAKYGYKILAYDALGGPAIRHSVKIIGHYETAKPVTVSEFFAVNDYVKAMAKITSPPAPNAKKHLELPVKQVGYKRKPGGRNSGSNRYRLHLILDDKEGVLEEEREIYWRNLARLIPDLPPVTPIEPTVTIGTAKPALSEGELLDEPLQDLERIVSDTVTLNKVRAKVIQGYDEYY